MYNFKPRAWILTIVMAGTGLLFFCGASKFATTSFTLLMTIGFVVLAVVGYRSYSHNAFIVVLESSPIVASTIAFLAFCLDSRPWLALSLVIFSIHLALWIWLFGGSLRANGHVKTGTVVLSSGTSLALGAVVWAVLIFHFEMTGTGYAWNSKSARQFLWNQNLLAQLLSVAAVVFCVSNLIGAHRLPAAMLHRSRDNQNTPLPLPEFLRQLAGCLLCLGTAAVVPVMLTSIPLVLSVFTIWFIGYGAELMVDVVKGLLVQWLIIFVPLFLFVPRRFWISHRLLVPLVGILLTGVALRVILLMGVAVPITTPGFDEFKQVWFVAMLILFTCTEFLFASLLKAREVSVRTHAST